MSEHPGSHLVELVSDNFNFYHRSLTAESFQAVLEFYKPHEAELERRAEKYYEYEDEPSWRDWRDYVWEGIPTPPEGMLVYE